MLTNQVHWLSEAPHHRTGVRVLQGAIGAALLFRCFTEARFALFLWGPSGIGNVSAGWLPGPTVALAKRAIFGTVVGTYVTLAVLATGAMFLLLGRRARLGTSFSLGAMVALEQRLPDILDGGDNMMRIVLVYLLFAMPSDQDYVPGQLRVWMHNLSVVAIILQTCVLYETSGLMKAYGERWHNGTAMYYIMQVSWLSLPSARRLFRNPAITTVSTYAPMLYQVLFPVAVVSRLRLIWIAMGVLFHLGIAILMGLFSFSAAMAGLELLLIRDSEYATAGRWLRNAWRVTETRARSAA